MLQDEERAAVLIQTGCAPKTTLPPLLSISACRRRRRCVRLSVLLPQQRRSPSLPSTAIDQSGRRQREKNEEG